MAERRAGGETGVAWVEALSGDEVWEKMRLNSWDEGGWSLKLVESALTRSHTLQQPRSGEKKEGNPGGSFCKRFPTLDEIEEIVSDPVAYRFMCAQNRQCPAGLRLSQPSSAQSVAGCRYTDGTKATMLLFNGLIGDFNFAAKLKGRDELLSCQMYLDAGRAPETPNNVQCKRPDPPPKLRLGCCLSLIGLCCGQTRRSS